MKTLAEIPATVARQHAGRSALVESDRAVSYGELEKGIASLSKQLHSRGVRSGDCVALFLPNSLEFVTGYFAIAALGAVVAPLNDQYQRTELAYFLDAAGVSLVVTSRRYAALADEALRSLEGPCRLFFVEDGVDDSGTGSLGDLAAVISPDAPAMRQFSSGSTGGPKRISRSHRNLLFEIDSLAQTLALKPEDRFLGVAPFSHVNGLMRSMMASLRAGATLYPCARFDRRAVAEIIEKRRISVFIGVPFMFGVLAKTNFPRQPDFSSLRLCVSASAPMPPKVNRQFHQRFGLHVRQLYGSTETGTISVDLSSDEKSLESVGMPVAGVETEIFAENGEPTETGEIGEIAVKSPGAIQSYDGCGELDTASFRNGYFFTGDLGRIGLDGRLYLVGRKKIFINKAGYKINPREIELLLETHPKIEEAVVLGLPSSFGDERVKATVVLNAPCSEEEIIWYCRGRIADFKVPSVIEFRDRLPKTPTGKIRRELLGQE